MREFGPKTRALVEEVSGRLVKWVRPDEFLTVTTLAVERHEGQSLWLVAIPSSDHPSIRLARFVNAEAVEAWKQARNAEMLSAREVGRSGL